MQLVIRAWLTQLKKFKDTDGSANHRTTEQFGLEDTLKIPSSNQESKNLRSVNPGVEDFLDQAQPLVISSYLTTEFC